MTVTDFLAQRVLPILLPAPCLGCEEPLESGKQALGLCIRCRGRLRPLTDTRCPGCGRPLRAVDLPPEYRCGSCRRRKPAFDRLVALWSYRPPLDAVMRAFKFRRLEFLGVHLARELSRRFHAGGLEADVVVWVPLHWRRHLARGYNQAERIATPLACRLDLPAERALTRSRATPAQTSLPREERTRNLRRAFRLSHRGRVTGRRVLLVDDVMTTGATLTAAAAVLRTAGAREITAFVAARTPGPEEPYVRKTVIW